MTGHGRKYGERPSHPIYVWNGLLEAKHRRRIGEALWEFLWCLDRITEEQDGIGIVLGRKPVKAEEVAASFGVGERTVRRHFDRLQNEGYITRTLTPYGYSIQVRNSQKFRPKEVGQKCPTSNQRGRTEKSDLTGQDCPTSPDKSVRPNKEKAVEKAMEQAASAAVWDFLGVNGSRWLPSVRELCQNLYAAKNGQTPVELIGACMDGIEALGESIPARLAQRATELRAQKTLSAELPELEATPWAK